MAGCAQRLVVAALAIGGCGMPRDGGRDGVASGTRAEVAAASAVATASIASTGAGAPVGSPAPAARPYRLIAASGWRTCVLGADGALTCWGVVPRAKMGESPGQRFRIVPKTQQVREMRVTEDVIYLLSTTGELEIVEPPWAHSAYAPKPRPRLPEVPADLRGRFAWMHVNEILGSDSHSMGCARRVAPDDALVCWRSPKLNWPADAWVVHVHRDLPDAVDAEPDEDGVPEHLVHRDGRVDGRASPGSVRSVAGACVVHADRRVSCLERGEYRPFSALGKVRSLQSIPRKPPLRELHAGAIYHCALSDDGVVRCRIGGIHTCDLRGSKSVQGAACERLEQPGLVDAKALATGAEHVCILNRSDEVFCWGPSDVLGGREFRPGDPETAVRVVP